MQKYLSRNNGHMSFINDDKHPTAEADRDEDIL